MKKLALFDLDGTLFDTREVNYMSYQHALQDLGYEIDHDYYVSYCNGRHYTEFLPKIIKCKKDIEIVHEKKKNYYSSYLSFARVNNSLIDIIKKIRKNYYIVIVTTASFKNTKDILDYFSLSKYFDDIITPKDYKKTKPDPEPFLVAMKKYDISSNNTIIFEDSDVGILSAINTGASVFKIQQF